MTPGADVLAKETPPNILIFMVDQLTGTLFEDGPADWLHAPNLKRLAARSVRFSNAYCASPLCGPSRASFMTGLLPSATGGYDNAAAFPSDMPTFAHHLRGAGYQTCLAGKMHFVGPDQLHGYEERLTTDIYPADFGWTPDYCKPGERIDWWYHNMASVTGAGVAEITNQLEYDDEVAHHATQKIHDLGRAKDPRPWSLTVSFTHPHDPYVARQKYWDLYEDCEHLLPRVPALDYSDHDPHSKRILDANDWHKYDISEDDIRRSRRAYFANLSYLDDKVGQVLAALEGTGQDAAILFVADHGDMLGERGLWFKMTFREGSARVPLMIAAPGLAPARIDTPVSLLDICPTLCDLAQIDLAGVTPWTEGQSLLPLARGVARTEPVAMEYAAEGSHSPLVALRDGRWKYIKCTIDPEQLFDLETDPDELTNLADNPTHAATLERFRRMAATRWDLERFDAAVRASQTRRRLVYEALRQGTYTAWDHQPVQTAANRYMRNHMDLNTVESTARVPKIDRPPVSP
ncbi:choline-sulfatase [Oceaniovalibus sp. ACAM 378]|uniref:choline-sulfatase n=1 Tax=Oceaniovalibus sp. ACAM 378 TaxID=2599923 RepID=UPI0011D82021|nr:choline-sulfatase [Oceaniovalibus sp. ACAM 378]TYB84440.1 choline-sulfatase [Oceaniovalibus sp. ACAM 378]